MDIYAPSIGWLSFTKPGLYWGVFLHEDYRVVAESSRGTPALGRRGNVLLGVFALMRRWVAYYADGDPTVIPLRIQRLSDTLVDVNGVEHRILRVGDREVLLHPELYEKITASNSDVVVADPLGCAYTRIRGVERVFCRLRDQYPVYGKPYGYVSPGNVSEYAVVRRKPEKPRVPAPKNEPYVAVIGDLVVDVHRGLVKHVDDVFWEKVEYVDPEIDVDKPTLSASFLVTFRCPRRCRHCLRQILSPVYVELAVDELIEEYSKRYVIVNANFNGGEPLLRIDEIRDAVGLLDGSVRTINTSLALSTLSESDLAWLVDTFYTIFVGVHDSWFTQDDLNDVQLRNLGRVVELIKRYNHMNRPRRIIINVQVPWHEFGLRVAKILGVPVSPASAVEGWDALSTRYAAWNIPGPPEGVEYNWIETDYNITVFPDGTNSYCVFQPRLPPGVGEEFSARLWEYRRRYRGGVCPYMYVWNL